MVKSGFTYLIPLMTRGDSHAKIIETVKGSTKIKKLIKDHSHHLMWGHVWCREEDEDDDTSSKHPAGLEFNVKHRNSMMDLPWSHEQLPTAQLKHLETRLSVELRLTESEVQTVMTYVSTKIEQDGSDKLGGQALNVAMPTGESSVKSSLLDQQERDSETWSTGHTGRNFSTMGDVR